MKKFILLTCILLAPFGLFACSIEEKKGNEMQPPDIVGYILDINASAIFVVSKEAKDLSADDGIEEFYDAIWLREAPENLELGQLVKVWYEGPVEESFPAGGTIGELEVVRNKRPEGATLNESEALQKALETEEPDGHFAVRSIYFEKTSTSWEVEWKETPDGERSTVHVKDE